MADDPPRDFGFDLFYAPCGAFEYCSHGPVSCCCALGCCSLQTWGAFHKQSGNVVPPGSGEIGYTERQVDCAVLFSVLAGMTGGERQQGEPGAASLLRTAINVAATAGAAISAGKMRQILVRRYYGMNVDAWYASCTHLCCGPCANVQEIDAIIKMNEFRNPKVTIGFGPACRCWRGPESPLDCVTCACFSCVQPWDLEKNTRFVAPPPKPPPQETSNFSGRPLGASNVPDLPLLIARA